MASFENEFKNLVIKEDSTERIKNLLEEQSYLDESFDGETYRDFLRNKYLMDVDKFNNVMYKKTYSDFPRKCEELKNNELFFEVLLVLKNQEDRINELEKKLEKFLE